MTGQPFSFSAKLLVDAVAIALHVAVEVGDVVGDQLATRVVPGTRADAIARVHGRLAAWRAGAQVRAPGAPRRRRQAAALRHLRAVGVGAGQAAVVGAVALAHAGDEERRRPRRCGARRGPPERPAGRLLRRLGKRHERSKCGKCSRRKNMSHPSHLDFLPGLGTRDLRPASRSPLSVVA